MPEPIKSFKKVTEFHEHVCPGSALGYRAAKAGMKKINQRKDPPTKKLTIVENDSCAVDAIQVVSGCTRGKGT